MLARAMLHSSRNLLVDGSEEKKRAREDAKLDALLRRNPRKISGFNILFKEVCSIASADGGEPLGQQSKVELLRAAHAQWRTMVASEKEYYRRTAASESAEKASANADALVAHREQVRLRRARLKEVEAEGASIGEPLRLGSCRWSSEDLKCASLTSLHHRKSLRCVRRQRKQNPCTTMRWRS